MFAFLSRKIKQRINKIKYNIKILQKWCNIYILTAKFIE